MNESLMDNIEVIKFHCTLCSMEFEVKYDNDNFVRPSHCVGCGSDEDLVEVDK